VSFTDLTLITASGELHCLKVPNTPPLGRTPLADHHTAQVPAAGVAGATQRGGRSWMPSRWRPSCRDATTATGALFTVSVWARADAPVPIDALAAALRQPQFCPSLGRKSCPLRLPPAPALMRAEHSLAPMQAREEPEPERLRRRALAPGLAF
jgi:CRISPR system Cascade subunit CasD